MYMESFIHGYTYYNQMKSSKYESIYLPSQWCVRSTCCGFGVLSKILFMKYLHINDMTLDNDLKIPQTCIIQNCKLQLQLQCVYL